MDVPKKKSEAARSVLPAEVPLKKVVANVANAGMIVAGFVLKDVDLIGGGINDAIVEPARAHLIPGYEEVRKRALGAGALAVTISGAGPSLVAFVNGQKQDPAKICRAMEAGFKSANLSSLTKSCKPDSGARVIESVA
jgi:homoserine kinase